MRELFVFAAIVVSAISSQASILWWQIENPSGLAGESGWDTANLYARNLTTGEKGDVLDSVVNLSNGSSAMSTVTVSNLGSGFGYYVELMSGANLVGYTANSSAMTYAELNTAGSITTDDLEVVPTAVWHGGSFNAPEPTSAMLMMMGAAALALRRKQRKVA